MSGTRRRLARIANIALAPFGAQIASIHQEQPWDRTFARWIGQAKILGKDPNDTGDIEWAKGDPFLGRALTDHYYPHITASSVVLEVGPGTGRLTRHVITRCKEMVLVERSKVACRWLRTYLKGKGKFTVHQIDSLFFPMIEPQTVDVVLAHGVLHHLDLADLSRLLDESYRVLRPGGVFASDFQNIMTPEGLTWFKGSRDIFRQGSRRVFRFYHPETVSTLVIDAGYQILRVTAGDGRIGYVELMKPE